MQLLFKSWKGGGGLLKKSRSILGGLSKCTCLATGGREGSIFWKKWLRGLCMAPNQLTDDSALSMLYASVDNKILVYLDFCLCCNFFSNIVSHNIIIIHDKQKIKMFWNKSCLWCSLNMLQSGTPDPWTMLFSSFMIIIVKNS